MWIALVVAFLVAYRLFAPAPGQPHRDVSWLPWAIPFVFIGLFFFFYAPARGAQKAWLEGTSLATRGRYLEALPLYEKAAKLLPRASGIFLSQAYALACLWRADEAEGALAQAAKQGSRFGQPDLSRTRYPLHALVEAILGKADLSRAQLADAERAGALDDPHATLARLVLAVRAREWAQASSLGRSPELGQLGGVFRGLTEALLAWAAAEQGLPSGPVNSVAVLAEAGPDAVQKVWPEFADFLKRSDRGGAAA